MKERTTLSRLIRSFLLVCVLVLVVIAAVAMIGWWERWTRLEDFEKAVMLAGSLVIGMGLISMGWKIAIRSGSDSSESSPEEEGPSRGILHSAIGELVKTYRLSLIALTAGMVCLLIGWLLE